MVKDQTGRHPAYLDDDEESEALVEAFNEVARQQYYRLRLALEQGQKEFRCTGCGRNWLIKTENRYQITTSCPYCDEDQQFRINIRGRYDYSGDSVSVSWDRYAKYFPDADSPEDVDLSNYEPDSEWLAMLPDCRKPDITQKPGDG